MMLDVGKWQKFVKFHELPRKLLHFVTLTPTHPGGGGLEDTISASSFEKYILNAIILSDYPANIPGGSREVGREGRGGGGWMDGWREGTLAKQGNTLVKHKQTIFGCFCNLYIMSKRPRLSTLETQ